jgi:hypothetical protein
MCYFIFPQSALRCQEVCEGRGLKNRGINRWLAWALAALILLSGCSGVLFESKTGAGRSESLKLGSGEGWESYDKNPRHPFDKRNSSDEMSIMLKSVKTF